MGREQMEKTAGLWTGTHTIALLLFCLLVAAAIGALKLKAELLRQTDTQITGSYMTRGSSGLPGTEYLVFDRNGSYYHYRQFEMLETGTYQAEDDDVCTLESDGGDVTGAVHMGRTVYTMEGETVTVYERFSDSAVFINVRHNS